MLSSKFCRVCIYAYQFPHVHDRSHTLVNVPGLFLGEVQDVECIVCELHVFVVIDGGDGRLSLADEVVVVDVFREQALLLQVWHGLLKHLVEDVVRPLHLLLESDARFLQEVSLDVATSKLPLDVEMYPDEFALLIKDV